MSDPDGLAAELAQLREHMEANPPAANIASRAAADAWAVEREAYYRAVDGRERGATDPAAVVDLDADKPPAADG